MSRAKNINPWCKVMYRDWLESERIMDMSLAAEGLYHRCLMAQAQRGSIPADLQKLARLLAKDYDELVSVWHEVEPHFDVETVDGEDRLYNVKQRELLDEAEAKAASYASGSKKGWQSRSQDDAESKPRPNPNKTQTKPKQNPSKSENTLTQNRAIRASVSASVCDSVSDSESESDKEDARAPAPDESDGLPDESDAGKAKRLQRARAAQAFEQEFWPAYPVKEKKARALDAWHALSPDDKLKAEILRALEHHKRHSERWQRGIIPHASSWLRDRRWLDEIPGEDSYADDAEPPEAKELPPLDIFPADRWNDVMHRMALDDAEGVECWLQPLQVLGTHDGCLYLAASGDTQSRYVMSNYRADLQQHLNLQIQIITEKVTEHV